MIYSIKKSSGGKPTVVLFNRLTPYAGDNAEPYVAELNPPVTE